MRCTLVALLLASGALIRSHAEQVVISEIMYHPTVGKPEFVEILNLTSNRLDLAKWRLRDGVEYTFPAFAPGGSVHFLGEYERIVVSAADPATTRAAYPEIPPTVRVFGPWSGTTALDDAGERILLEDAAGARLCELNYGAGGKWPVAANGTGHSIIVANANRKIDDWRNWQLSPRNGGSPGNSETSVGVPPSNIGVRLSEAHFSASRVDWVELGNLGTSSFSSDGYFVASLKDFSDKVPLPASIPANGQASVAVNFPTDGDGDVVLYLIDAQNNVVDSVALSRRGALNSVQRFPLSSSEWYYGDTATKDAPNNPARHDEIVINEIMFATPSRHDQGQFIELINKSATAVNLTGWRLADGLRYDFPGGTTLAAGAYLVVAKDPAFMAANYGGVSNVFGPADGSLRRNGELVRLEDDRGNLADSVDFRVGGEWPADSGGAGSSLELLNAEMDNSRPSSWRASDESAKSTFQSFSHTGLYRELRGTPSGLTSESRELLLNLVSDGHIVLRNISLASSTTPGTNIIPNGVATSHTGSGATGFLCTGTHCMSDTLADGFHLISTGAGDTKANKAEVDITSITPNATTPYILSFEARWVSGMPLLVAQTWDRSFGKVFRLPLPNNLGTPGAANSRFNAAPPPTVDTLSHSPKVPTSTQPVVVTARVSSVAPLSAVTLFHKTDAGGAAESYTSIAMNDDGTSGDALAGDGIWSGTIGAKNDGAITQFYVRATSSNGEAQDLPRNATGVAAVNGSVLRVPARPAMYIVDNSPPASAAGILTERYILSLFDRNSLNTATGFSSTRDWDYPRMSNFGHNATMIYNENDVVYNCEMRKGGSPWTRDGSNAMARIRYRPPADNQWRNRSKSGIDNDAGGANRFHNRTVRYMLYMLGQAVPDSEFCQRIVNADPPGLGDDQEQTDDDFFDRAYADTDGGELFEIDDAWFVYDRNNMDDRLPADSVTGRWVLGDWTNPSIVAPSEESPIYFHGNWPLRFPEERYDYASLAGFIKTAYNNNTNINAQAQATQDAWREQMERMIDVERAAAYAAARGYIGDWDNFTLNRGKNGYFYKRPTDGKFEFHHWDSDLGFDAAQGVIGTIGGTGWTNLSRTPYFRRHFNFYLTDLQSKINGADSRMAAFLAAMNYQSANPNGLAPFKTNVFNYTTWFSSRNSRITTEINSFGGTNNTTRLSSVSTANNQTVDTPLFTLNGEAPAGVYSVDVLNHPEGLFKWVATSTNAGLWTITGLALANDANALTVRFLAQDGTVLSSVPFTVTFTGNGFPLPRLTMNPASGNLAANEVVTFDGSASTDPENAALTFVWSVVPAAGAVLTASGASATAHFTVPGTYTVTMTAIDPATNMASTSRAITVSNADDFVPFSSKRLPAGYTLQNAEYRDNYSPSTWLSLEDNTGRMLIQITDDAARPLAAPTFSFPLITRDLPDSADFILQTALDPMTREVGNWQAGLWLEMVESGVLVRYAFDLDGGLNLRVRSAANPATFSQLAFAAHTGSGVTMRVRRTGDSLFFERQTSAGVWTIVHTQAIAPGSTANTGGIFSATSAATSALIAFDYILVADSTVTNNILSSLRITEVMYHPASPDTVEFIELRNIGAAAINLAGCRFADGEPFAEFVFPNIALNPGGYVVLTNNLAAFTARYGASAAIVGQWAAGNGLSNSGENIRLLDPNSNEVHNFSYATIAPWPVTPNGQGPSLEVIDTEGSYALGTNWRASGEAGGTPGFSGHGPDTDGDGQPDASEALFGTDPNDPNSRFIVTGAVNANGEAQLTFTTVLGKQYRIDYTDSLSPANWQTLTTVAGTGAEVTFTDPTTPTPAQRFYHVVILP